MKRILLFLILLYGVNYLKAQTVTFDGISTVPSSWTTTSSSGNLALSTTRFKSGTQSLKWTPTNNQTLTASALAISAAQTENSTTSVTRFYIYTNTNNASDTLLVQFLNPSGAVQRTGTIVLNFTGWREYHRNLVSDYGGGNALTGFDLSAVKFTFKKKSGTTGSRQIWIDQINWVGGDTKNRYPGPHLLVDNSQFEVTSSLRGGQPLTSWLNTPDTSLVTPTSTQLSGIDTLKKRYNIIPTTATAPNVTGAELSEARAYYKFCGPSLSGGTLNYTRGLLSDSNPDSLVKFSKYCNIFARKYFNNPTQSNLDTLTLFTRYLIDQGVAEGGRNVMETNSYTNARTFNNNFLIVVPLISDANVKADLVKMLRWSNEYNKIYSTQFLVRNNMDFIHLKLEYIIKLALLNNDNAEIVRDLKSIGRFMTQVMTPGDGGRDGLKPDGLGFHHRSKYFHYMYAYATWIDHAYNLRATPFKISLEAYNHMLKAVKVIFLEQNKGVVRANSTSGRLPFSQSPAVRTSDFRNLVTVGGDIKNQNIDSEAAALYNYFYKTNFYTVEQPLNLDGFHQFNYGQLGIKRNKNWVAVAKGLTNKMFGTEIYEDENRYGRYQGYGALDILYETASATGYISGGNGWDWNVMPGTTSVHLSNYADLRPPTNSVRDEYQAKSFAGALSAGNDGIFAMDFVQDDGGRYSTNNLTFRKSVFAFDSILVCLGSKINGTGGIVATNLFQSIHSSTNPGIFINSLTATTSNATTNLSTTGSNWIVNGQTTGFFIPAGNNQIQVFRGSQTTPINTSNTPSNTASANASKAWINHGTTPSNASYQYVVVPSTTPAKMQALATSINQGTVYQVLADTFKYHAVKYIPSNTTSYSFFEGDSSINIGYIEKVTNNCLITIKEVGDTLTVRIANPDLNTFNVSEPSVDWNSAPSNVSLTLSRRWRFLQSSSPDSTNTVNRTNFANSIKLDFVLNKGNYTEVKLVKDRTEMGYGVWNNVEEAIWFYDLSTAVSPLYSSSSYTSSSTASVVSDSTSLGFLPYPPYPSKTRVAFGSSGNGSFNRIGSGDNRKIRVFANSTSLNKFSAYDIGDKSVVSTFFTLTFGAEGTNGNWILGLGNNAITNVFTSPSNLSSSAYTNGIFSAFRFDLGSTNNISFKYRKMINNVPSFVEIDNTTFIKGVENFVELYSNNSKYSSSYTRKNISYTVNAQCYHLWVNGNRIAFPGGNNQIPSTELDSTVNINSFFITSTGNTTPTNNSASLTIADMQMRYKKTTSNNQSSIDLDPELEVVINQTPANMLIYPNPASEQVTAVYYASVNKIAKISLVNTLGVVCLKVNQPVKEGSNKIILDTSELNPGVYIVNIDGQKGKIIIK